MYKEGWDKGEWVITYGEEKEGGVSRRLSRKEVKKRENEREYAGLSAEWRRAGRRGEEGKKCQGKQTTTRQLYSLNEARRQNS